MCEMACQLIQKKQEEKRIEEVQAAKAQNSNIPVCYDDDDDYNSAIIPNEPVDSLSMGDEHLNTILATELDEFIKSCVKNLVPNPSESEGGNGCDVPACFTTFLNVLFDAEYEFNSSNDQSCSDEDVLEKIFSNPLFDKEIIYMKIDPHHFNAESDLIESILNNDSSIIPSSSKIYSLLDEFAGKLTLLKSIPPGIDETDCYHENEIRLIERLLYDNSSPRPPKEYVSKNYDSEIESFSPSPIPIKDSDSFMEEIDLTFTPDDPMPPGIEDDDYDSERDILISEELFENYSISLPVIESYHFDIPLFSRPPAKPPDVVQDSRKCEDSCQRILSSKSSFPQLQLGIKLAGIRDNLGPNNGYRRSIIGDFSEYNDLRDCGRRVTATNTISAEKPISIPAKHVQPTKRGRKTSSNLEADTEPFSRARQQRFITRIVGAPSNLMSSIKSAQSGFLNFELGSSQASSYTLSLINDQASFDRMNQQAFSTRANDCV
nr:hypothetical protein [Tanacetum cinerariifolium]